MVQGERIGTAGAVERAWADGSDLMAGLLAMPRAARVEVEVEAPMPAPSADFAALLARPVSERVWVESDAPAPIPVAVPVEAVPVPPPAPTAPPVPAQSKNGRLMRQPRPVVSDDAHGTFDKLLAESVAAMPVNQRLGKCKVCGAAKGVCRIGPFWGD